MGKHRVIPCTPPADPDALLDDATAREHIDTLRDVTTEIARTVAGLDGRATPRDVQEKLAAVLAGARVGDDDHRWPGAAALARELERHHRHLVRRAAAAHGDHRSGQGIAGIRPDATRGRARDREDGEEGSRGSEEAATGRM